MTDNMKGAEEWLRAVAGYRGDPVSSLDSAVQSVRSKHARAILAELERLRAEREWRPIETAQDGFYLVHEDGAIRVMMLHAGKWEQPGIPVLTDKVGNRLVSSEVKRFYGMDLELSDCCREPTHWMPLPQPPAAPSPATAGEGK